jgi:hypothetical protein
MESVSVSASVLRIAPPVAAAALPPLSVRPVSDTGSEVPAFIIDIEDAVALSPLTVNRAAPGPAIVTAEVIANWPDVSEIVPGPPLKRLAANAIVSAPPPVRSGRSCRRRGPPPAPRGA